MKSGGDMWTTISLCPHCKPTTYRKWSKKGHGWKFARGALHDQEYEEAEAGAAWDAAGCGGDESPADSCPFAGPWRISCARFWAACIAALGGDCLFFGFAASATILIYVYFLRQSGDNAKIRLAAHTVQARAAPHPIHPGWCS
jgi:hypothetical protein